MKAATVPPVTSTAEKRSFSLPLFLLIVFLLSWPPQFWYVFRADTGMEKFLFSSIAMVMVAVGAWIAGGAFFRDGFAGVGWRFGKGKQYLLVFAFALFLWAVPVLIEQITGMQPANNIVLSGAVLFFFLHLIGTLLPAFGEEFGWRGYLLPRLSEQYGARKGLLLHALIWWAWHLPVLIGMGLKETVVGSDAVMNVLTVVLVSAVPSILHAVIFAYIWAKTKSIWVATFYHAAFDEVRDALEASFGLGPFAEIWQMVGITLLGGVLLWRVDWQTLLKKPAHDNHH